MQANLVDWYIGRPNFILFGTCENDRLRILYASKKIISFKILKQVHCADTVVLVKSFQILNACGRRLKEINALFVSWIVPRRTHKFLTNLTNSVTHSFFGRFTCPNWSRISLMSVETLSYGWVRSAEKSPPWVPRTTRHAVVATWTNLGFQPAWSWLPRKWLKLWYFQPSNDIPGPFP